MGEDGRGRALILGFKDGDKGGFSAGGGSDGGSGTAGILLDVCFWSSDFGGGNGTAGEASEFFLPIH